MVILFKDISYSSMGITGCYLGGLAISWLGIQLPVLSNNQKVEQIRKELVYGEDDRKK